MTGRVAVKGIGLVTPLALGLDTLCEACGRATSPPPPEIAEIPSPEGIASRDIRRMARLTRLSLYAAQRACARAGVLNAGDCGIIVALTHGATSYLQEFHDYLFDYGPQLASPNAFSNGVTNAPLGAISKLCGLRAGGMTLAGYEQCGMQALHLAVDSILDGTYRHCCVGASEEYSPLVAGAYARLGWYTGGEVLSLPSIETESGFSQSEGSVFMVLGPEHEVKAGNCLLSAVELSRLDTPVDLVISGAGGGPQDRYEQKALESVISKQKTPPAVLFSKPFFGETFAVGALLSSAIACDILSAGHTYPAFPLEPGMDRSAGLARDPLPVRSVLVLSAARSGEVLAGLFEKA